MSELHESRAASVSANEPERAGRNAPSARRVTAGSLVTYLAKYPMLIALAILLIVTTIIYPGFWNGTNLRNLISQNSGLMFCSVGMTFVIIAGGFDLSVGSVFAAGAMLYISFVGKLSAPLAVLLAVCLGAVAGLINGFVINRLRVNPFVATLGTASVFLGLIELHVGSTIQFASSGSFLWLGNTTVGGFPLDAAVGILALIVFGVLLAKTTFGRSVYAVGGNTEAARLAGIRVGLISSATFVIIGVLAAVGGVFLASQLGTAQPDYAGNITLQSIAVVVVGGTVLSGGEGAMWRTAVGLAIIAVLVNLTTAKNFSSELQTVLQGAVVIAAVALDAWLLSRQSRRR